MTKDNEQFVEASVPTEDEAKNGVRMYENVVQHLDGTTETIGYAYGPPWVGQALLMDDISFRTPEEAIDWWKRWVDKHGE